MEKKASSVKYILIYQGTYEEITALRVENTQLRRELDLLKAVVISMDRRMTILDDGITDLHSRSMRDNILIHHYPHPQMRTWL